MEEKLKDDFIPAQKRHTIVTDSMRWVVNPTFVKKDENVFVNFLGDMAEKASKL